MSAPTVCQKCSSPLKDGWDNVFTCGSVQYTEGPLAGSFEERPWCWKLQRDQLAAELEAIRTASAALVERVHAAEAVLTDPHALWGNWLRGTVKLPAGIGDIRQAEERVKRMLAAGDQMAEWLRNPRNLGDDPFMADQWEATKGQP